MNNFGVVEIANTRATAAPGWAYVADTGRGTSAASQSTNRKRAARNLPGLSLSDQSARQEAKIRKELEALDRDTSRDVNIPIPGGRGMAEDLSPI
jgi:zinc finger HIT domain-containing protein 1